MNLRLNFTIAIIALLFFFPIPTSADTVILKTGETIETSEVWEQGDKIFFYLFGQVLSIHQKDVQQIKRTKLDRNKSSQKPKKKETFLSLKNNESSRKDQTLNEDKQKSLRTGSPIAYNKVTKSINLNGFLHFRWEDNISSFEGLEKINTEADLDGIMEYFRPKDVLRLGKAKLKSIVYSFWHDKLYAVTIWTQSHFNYFALREEVFNQFGKGRKSDKHHERYIWSEGQTDRMLEYIKSGEYGLLWLRSKKMYRRFKLSELSGPIAYLRHIKSKDYKNQKLQELATRNN